MADGAIEGRVTAFCDGGSRGNPGPAGFGVFIQAENGSALAELSDFIGIRTNNVAEYSGLLAALDWAVTHGARELRVVSDSELMVKQMKGQYSVKSPDLKPLYEEAKRRVAKLGRFEMQHVLRGKNKEADRLANEAMDRGTGKGPAGRPSAGSAAATKSPAAAPKTPVAGPQKSAAGTPATTPASRVQGTLPLPPHEPLKEVTGFVKNGVVHLVEGTLPEGTFVRILPARR
ncbi:ribonuclease HI family protein [Acidipila sp. EB88]|uniref:ribonuclease HI family protein n=1 Tax=Acidipila sp. EB88 TaxID=2305226 RepID=UPI000F5E17CB|nr:ribonuclease HI family protein [Acidipila sp. EB88]RRA48074.1 ribonuclease HI [Acidipila sp. EB88]